MTATFFVDTNVLLYAASNAADDRSKRQAARALLGRPDIALSAQVLKEFYAAAVTKQRLQMTHEEALAVLKSLAAFPVCPISRDLVPGPRRDRRQAALRHLLLGRRHPDGSQTDGL